MCTSAGYRCTVVTGRTKEGGSMRKLAVAVVLVVAMATPAAATSAYEARANDPQVAGSPGTDTAVFPTNKQNEPTIAVNPVDSRRLVAGANDEQRQPPCGPGPVRGPDAPANDCSFFPDVGTSGVYTSADGGRSWTNRGLLDDQPAWQASPFVSDGDPVLAYGPRPDGHGGFTYAAGARVYYATLASYKSGRSPYPPNKAPELIVVSYSDDDGATWSAPVVATVKRNPNDFNDKNWLWVDKAPTSPFFGRVYVSWTEFRSSRCCPAEPVMVAFSADGGASFSRPVQLSGASNSVGTGGRQGTQVASGPDGTLFVVWNEGNAQVIAISRDGGRTFGRAQRIAAVSPIDD
ncbi:MAG: hypothetical protein C4344_02020, partial [Acidimicrobiia bacterium]